MNRIAWNFGVVLISAIGFLRGACGSEEGSD